VKKICYIVSDINKALSFEWIADHFRTRVDLVFILIGNKGSAMERFLVERGIRNYVVEQTQHKNIFRKILLVRSILKKEKPHAVHCHLWTAMLVGLSASWLARIPKRVFTRHHALIHYREFPSGRKWDRLCNAIATDIIAITERMKSILVDFDGADPKKITLINHGFDLDFFQHVDNDQVSRLREKYQIPRDRKVIGVIGRYIELKGIPYIIQAFTELYAQDAKLHLVMANAKGPYASAIRSLLNRLPTVAFTEIEFEENLPALYRMFSVYVHAPIYADAESFGQTYVEALAAGIPSVFTLAGVAGEFIQHEVNALVVDYKNSDQIKSEVERLLSDEDLRQKLVSGGKQSVQRFSLQEMLSKLEELYA
jgi:glycosyltransferase involved in cell wall biosynthesis